MRFWKEKIEGVEMDCYNDSDGIVKHCNGETNLKSLQNSNTYLKIIQVQDLMKNLKGAGIKVGLHYVGRLQNITAYKIAAWGKKNRKHYVWQPCHDEEEIKKIVNSNRGINHGARRIR